jgi:hypothetical protein
MCFISHSRKDVLRTYRDSRVTDSSIISVATGQIEEPQVSCAPGPLLVADINSESNVDVIPQSLWRRQTNQGLRRECATVRVRNLVSSAPISHEARWEAFCALLHGRGYLAQMIMSQNGLFCTRQLRIRVFPSAPNGGSARCMRQGIVAECE